MPGRTGVQRCATQPINYRCTFFMCVVYILLISELHLLCTVCTTIVPRVLHFSAVHLYWISTTRTRSSDHNGEVAAPNSAHALWTGSTAYVLYTWMHVHWHEQFCWSFWGWGLMAPVIHSLGKPHSRKHYSLKDTLSSMGPFNAPNF